MQRRQRIREEMRELGARFPRCDEGREIHRVVGVVLQLMSTSPKCMINAWL